MYRARLVIAGSLICLAASALSALTLLPSYLALHSGEGFSSIEDTVNRTTDREDRDAIIRTQLVLTTLSSLTHATTTPTEAISRALSLRPRDIKVDHIAYTAGNPGALMIVGQAGLREAVNAYRQALNADPKWKSVSVPVGDLAGAPGATFSVTLSGDF